MHSKDSSTEPERGKEEMSENFTKHSLEREKGVAARCWSLPAHLKVRLAGGTSFFSFLFFFWFWNKDSKKGMRCSLTGAGDHRFDRKICVESFDYSQRCVLMTNADLFLGSRADQCWGWAPVHAQPRQPEIVAPNFLVRQFFLPEAACV